MLQPDIKEKLKQILSRKIPELKASDIRDDTSLYALISDSMVIVDIAVELEKEFGIGIMDMEQAKDALTSVEALAYFIETHHQH